MRILFACMLYMSCVWFIQNGDSNVLKTWTENSILSIGIIRSSHPEVLLIKDALKICSKFTGGHPCWSVISIKLQSNSIEIALWHGCFSVNLLHIFRTTFPRNTSGWLLLKMFKVIQSPTHFMFYYALLLLKVNFMFHLFL